MNLNNTVRTARWRNTFMPFRVRWLLRLTALNLLTNRNFTFTFKGANHVYRI